ncbi:MAG TPA: 16S rRNA methyltransferase [Candidatus Limnocylindria bacterium]
MSLDVVERVRRSARYRDVDPVMLGRLAAEELPRARNVDEAVKRVKRRLHQAVGAFRRAGHPPALAAAWTGRLDEPSFRAACAEAMRGHTSTRERLPHLETFFADIWAMTGKPRRVLDLGCGLNPLALPWMGIGGAAYEAVDVDERPLATVRDFLALVGQPHRVTRRDLVAVPVAEPADVALLLKLVTTLDRQDSTAAARLLMGVNAEHAVVTFTTRTLGGRSRGMERAYRDRLATVVAEVGRVAEVAEASVPGELVFILRMKVPRG